MRKKKADMDHIERYVRFWNDPGIISRCDRCGCEIKKGLADLKERKEYCIDCIDKDTGIPKGG